VRRDTRCPAEVSRAAAVWASVSRPAWAVPAAWFRYVLA